MRSCRPIISHTVDAHSNFRILLGTIRENPVSDLRGISCSDLALSDYLCLTLLRAHIEDQDIVVDTAIRYGLDGPGIESRCGRDFPHLSIHTEQLVQWLSGPFPRSKTPGACR